MNLHRSRDLVHSRAVLTGAVLITGLMTLLACQPGTDPEGPPNNSNCPDGTAARVVVNPHSAMLQVGDTLQLIATIPACLDVGPQTFTWSTLDTTVADVDPNTGVVEARRPGNTSIIARALPDSTVIADGAMVVQVTP